MQTTRPVVHRGMVLMRRLCKSGQWNFDFLGRDLSLAGWLGRSLECRSVCSAPAFPPSLELPTLARSLWKRLVAFNQNKNYDRGIIGFGFQERFDANSGIVGPSS